MKHILEITGTLLGVLSAALTALSLMKPRKREILMRKMKKYLRDLSQTINKCFLCIYQLIPGSSGKLSTEILDSRQYGLSDNYLAVKVTYRPVVFRIPFTTVKSNVNFWLGHIKDEHDYSWHALYDLPVEKTGRQFIWVSDNEEEQTSHPINLAKNRSFCMIFTKRNAPAKIEVILSGHSHIKPLSTEFHI